jgi:hypothetical protein
MPLALLRTPSFLPQSAAAFLFETHWSWWAATAVLAATLFYIARARADRRLLRTGQILLALTALWLAAALLIDTPAERLYTAHTSLANAVAQADLDRVFSCFDADFTVPSLALRGTDLVAAKTQLAATLKDNGIKDSTFTAFAATVHSNGTALSRITVRTTSNLGLIQTTWQLSWTDAPGQDWKIQHADLLKIGDEPFPANALIK